MRKTSTQYAHAREPYRRMHPTARMHHMVPVSREGADTEFNLFPWNETAHTAWHRLFCALTVREVHERIEEIHRLLFASDHDKIVRSWCLAISYHGRHSKKQDILTPQRVGDLQRCWRQCFGSFQLDPARHVLRYMMLYMVFGRYIDGPAELEPNPDEICRVLIELECDPHRTWAFRQLFGRLPDGSFLRDIVAVIERVRRSVADIPIH